MEFSTESPQRNIFLTKKKIFIQLLSPFAPHLAEESWEILGNSNSIFSSSWPDFDESKLIKSSMQIAIQVNGKLRGTIDLDVNEDGIIDLTGMDFDLYSDNYYTFDSHYLDMSDFFI